MALTIDGTSEVLAGLPTTFGFVPRHSLVLISTLHHTDRSATVGPMNRADLGYVVADPGPAVDAFARQVGDLPVQNVLAAMIHPSTNPADDTDLPRRDTADTITTMLNGHGFTDIDAIHVPGIAAGARWRSYQTPGRHGVLPDPVSTVFAAAAAAEGRIMADRRHDLVTRFTPGPQPLRERLHHPIAAAIADAGLDADQPAAALARLARADAAIRTASEGTLPTGEATIVDLIASIATIPFFDALIAVDGDLHLGAEDLAMHLWRHACEPVASRLATVIALHAYQRGDGTTARIALETADIQQPLPRLLLEMLDRCVPPTQIRTPAQEMSHNTRRALRGAQPTDKS
ncbi:DUF4192 domain-containing protein [Amycolatopsis sp. CA-128772]|uniref:DUF4192 domain-containing protein n=1 Tax=Amycolatopsis sp. CA-128772 TaxID=2073159 RepID=UPI000CD2A661|nr:DUF4192 domain-containing protein [Amycolatopsis sp. CA-128772]